MQKIGEKLVGVWGKRPEIGLIPDTHARNTANTCGCLANHDAMHVKCLFLLTSCSEKRSYGVVAAEIKVLKA